MSTKIELTPKSWPKRRGSLPKYSEELKLAAIQTYRTGQLGWKTAAKYHNVEPSSLRDWIKRAALRRGPQSPEGRNKVCSPRHEALINQIQQSPCDPWRR
ncbi:transposase [Rhizobium ruizarguesonis]